MKYAAADGALLWEKRIAYAYPAALVVDGYGNAIVTGWSSDGSNSFYTAKLAAADGALLWEKHYSGNLASSATLSRWTRTATSLSREILTTPTMKLATSSRLVLTSRNTPQPTAH